ncbi:uncharacterized protein LOC103990386 [Musa acuminata AAA Group]|uniref:uncharacterized protein LOC103990386 n=1 Tax=Musa acuminata AAA Group TaxID=214697 RepID=UPI0031DA215B
MAHRRLLSTRSNSSLMKENKSFKRKLEKKQKFYAKVKDAAVSLSAKKAISKKKRLRSRQKKMKVYDLSALSELLPDTNTTEQSSSTNNLKLNCKTRQKLVQREGAQLRQVLNDPSFQLDPLAAIHQHLQRTQPPACDKEIISGKAKRNKKRMKKPSSSSQSMDI